MSGRILCVREDAIATVTLSNPGKLNAIDFAMWQKLAEVLREISGDEQVRCVVLRGDGEQAFAAGGDIEEFLHRRDTLERALAKLMLSREVALSVPRFSSLPFLTETKFLFSRRYATGLFL